MRPDCTAGCFLGQHRTPHPLPQSHRPFLPRGLSPSASSRSTPIVSPLLPPPSPAIRPASARASRTVDTLHGALFSASCCTLASDILNWVKGPPMHATSPRRQGKSKQPRRATRQTAAIGPNQALRRQHRGAPARSARSPKSGAQQCMERLHRCSGPGSLHHAISATGHVWHRKI